VQSKYDKPLRPTLVLFCGLPGSGKTTTAKLIEKESSAIRLCTDDWLADLAIDLFDETIRDNLQNRLYRLCKELLSHGQDVILEDGLWIRSERDEKRKDAAELGAQTEMHYFNLSFNELWRRLEMRNASNAVGAVPITREQFAKYWSIFERPSLNELNLFDTYIPHSAVRLTGLGNW